MSFRERAKDALDRVRDNVQKEKSESERERAAARRKAAKARLKQAYQAIESAEPNVADGTTRGKSRTLAMFERAERVGQASAPVDATLETMGDPGAIESFATAGDTGTPQRQTEDDTMAEDMEEMILGATGETPDDAADERGALEFADPFGVTGGGNDGNK